MTTPDTTRWDDVPIVEVQYPTCPECGSNNHAIIKSLARGSDGSRPQRRVCLDCTCRFLVIYELPESGRTEDLEL